MYDKKLDEELRKELYELALTDESSRDDKYHGNFEVVASISLRDVIDYYYPKSLWLDKPEKKKRKRKMVRKQVEIKVEVKKKKINLKDLRENMQYNLGDNFILPEKNKNFPIRVNGKKIKWDEINVRDPQEVDISDETEDIIHPVKINFLQTIEEKIEAIKKMGKYFLRNRNFKATHNFVRELDDAISNKEIIIIDNEDNEVKRYLNYRVYDNYLIINGREIDGHWINLSKEEILKNVKTFVLDFENQNETLNETKLLFKKLEKRGIFLVASEMFNKWEV